jgi:hypothetical protein
MVIQERYIMRKLLANGELSDELARLLATRWGTSVRTEWRLVSAFRMISGAITIPDQAGSLTEFAVY